MYEDGRAEKKTTHIPFVHVYTSVHKLPLHQIVKMYTVQ